MLSSLTINNVVLIDSLSLKGEQGLCALTGETGAGKSILLDALGLAIGERAESRLIRVGEEKATVTAAFDLLPQHNVFKILKEYDIDSEDSTIILRRTLSQDGRSKAFINDTPISVQLLKDIGANLVEINGQFSSYGLLNSTTHLMLIDEYAEHSDKVIKVAKYYHEWKNAKEKLAQAQADIETSKLQEEYLTYAVNELAKLDVKEGEEAFLAEKRKRLLNKEKSQESLQQAVELLEDEQGILNLLRKLQSIIAKTEIAELLENSDRVAVELDELAYQIDAYKSGTGDDESLEQIEDRYFALKDCARKHRVTVDELPKIFEELSQKLRLITHQEDTLKELEIALKKAKDAFIAEASAISKKRKSSAEKLAKAVNAELPALKLDKAKLSVEINSDTNENNWNESGFDKVKFLVSTNPQSPAGEINKIASGGELSRFMLAIKVVLAENSNSATTLIFDEVDSGIGGATADAVGERLARLSEKYQILAVTHSPQVASRANSHWVISKSEVKGKTITNVTVLNNLEQRQDEIARMLSGATITKEAKAAAAKLLEREQANAA